MKEYSVKYTIEATSNLIRLQKSEPTAYKKVKTLISELVSHPTTGTGKPEPLRNDKTGQWSRRITKKHRLVYQILEEEVVVLVLSAYGHYDDN